MKASKMQICGWVALTYVILLVITVLLLWGGYSIPRACLYPQVLVSNNKLQEEGKYPLIPLYGSKVRDNYSDACMLNVAFCAKDGNALESLKNAMFANEPVEGDELEGLDAAVSVYPQIPECFAYSRYWHGYQIYLRPLLTQFNLCQIRVINYIFLMGLAIAMICLWWRKFGYGYAIILTLSLLSVSILIVPKCLHFSAVFYVGFISSIFCILSDKSDYKSIIRPVLFFSSGAITASLDLLTAPMIPVVLLLLTDSLMHEYSGTQFQQLFNRSKDLIGFGLLWCLGYALFWGTKFLIGSIILDTNLFYDGINQAVSRMDASYVSLQGWFMKVVLLPIKHNTLLAICMILLTYIMIRWKKYRTAIINNSWLLLIAMIEPLWLLLLRQHTIIHYNIFVWRSELILVLCIAIYVYRTICQTKENERTNS